MCDQAQQRKLVVQRPQIEGQIDPRGSRADHFLDRDELPFVRLAGPSRKPRAT